MFFQKIRRYEEGEGQGREREFQKIPILKENVEGLYDWLIQLMVYIDKMVNYDRGEEIMRTSRIKVVIQIAANLIERKGTEELIIPKQGSGEDYARRVVKFLVEAREEKRKDEKEVRTKMEWNVAAKAFQPREKKGEQEIHKRQVESEVIKLYPNGEVMVINKTLSSDNKTERNVDKVRIQEEDVDRRKGKEMEILRRRKEEDEKTRQVAMEEIARLR